MTELAKTYANLVRRCVVAFIYKFYDSHATGGKHPPFPNIIGTGFIVDSEGWVATNRHVAEAFTSVPDDVRHASGDVPPVMAVLFQMIEGTLHLLFFQVEQVLSLDVSEYLLTEFAPESPDIAFARIKVRGLPILELEDIAPIEEGTELASAGFPMGTDALAPAGYLEHLSPILQRGIVSAVLPFPGAHPHAFLMNIMVRGGASGSPVFLPESGRVAGIVYAGLSDRESSEKCSYIVPTNLTYVLPAHVISTCMALLREKGVMVPQPGAPTLAERIAETPMDSDPGYFPWRPLPELGHPSGE